MPEPSGLLPALLQLAGGLVLAFAGYRLIDGLAGFGGFLAGAGVGFLLGTAFGGPLVGVVAAIVLGILVAVLASFALRVAAVVLAAGLAANVALAFGLATWVVVVVAIVAGLVALAAHEWVILVATAAIGAVLASVAGAYLLRGWGIATSDVGTLVAALALTLLGIVAQRRAAQ